SGRVDADDELDALSCDAWRAIDDGVRRGWGRGLYVVYGFAAERAWVGEALGVHRSLRERGAERLRACGLADEGPGVPPTSADLDARIGALPGGGTNPWDAAVRELLLAVHDADGSGALDAPGEIAAVGCDTWAAIDAGVRRSWPNGLFVTY